MKKMKIFMMLVYLFLCFASILQAQYAVPATGGEAYGTTGTVSFTVGQVVYTTVINGDIIITQGVQQPYADSVVWISIPGEIAYVGEEYNYDGLAVSTSGGNVEYEMISGPVGMSIDQNTCEMSWTPSNTGNYDVSVKAYLVSDHSIFSIQNWTIVVKKCQIPAVFTGTILDESGTPVLSGYIQIWENATLISNPEISISDGTFSAELDEGVYNLYIYGEGFSGEWYENKNSIDEAAEVTAACSQTITVNFVVGDIEYEYFNIIGTVKDEATQLAIPNAIVKFYRFIPGQTSAEYFSSETTNALGEYSASFSSEYEYIVKAEATGYIPEFWNNTTDVLAADIIVLTSDVSGIDFLLTQLPNNTNEICGRVEDYDNNAILIPSWIMLYNHDGNGYSNMPYISIEAPSGTFSITGLPVGTYILQSQPFNDQIPSTYGYSPGYYESDDESVTTGWGLGHTYVFEITETSEFCPIIVRHELSPKQGDGPGEIIGEVHGNKNGIQLKGKGEKLFSENPIRGAVVYLLSQTDGKILRFAFSDISGKFDFDKLQLKGYDVIIDKINYDQFQAIIELTEENPVDSAIVEIIPTVGVEDEKPFNNLIVYPNPFTDVTMIEFTLPVQSDISVKVYNLTGDLVSTIYEGIANAGIQSMNLSGGTLPSGEYSIVLSFGNEKFVKKVMKIR